MLNKSHTSSSRVRKSTISRKTNETNISLEFCIDGSGKASIQTGIPFFDHMLNLFSAHGLFDISAKVKGDIDVDFHHSVEDVGIVLGQAFKEALGDKKGIVRYASALVPMDEALCQIATDISGRPSLNFSYHFPKTKVGQFDTELVEEFFHGFVNNAGISLHVDILRGKNLHHIIESCFKGFGLVLDSATQIDHRKKGIPSTKGSL
jgi:imidazoleglycerol-phosphate dehydratase